MLRYVMDADDAHRNFEQVMRLAVEEDAAVLLERGEQPAVVVLSAAAYARLGGDRPDWQRWRTLLAELHESIRNELGERPLTPPEDIIRKMREERDAQVLDLR